MSKCNACGGPTTSVQGCCMNVNCEYRYRPTIVEAFCAHCGEDFADLGLEIDEAPTDEHGSLYCCNDCLCDARAEAWENRYCSPIPPDSNCD
jgi:hypothetical protein